MAIDTNFVPDLLQALAAWPRMVGGSEADSDGVELEMSRMPADRRRSFANVATHVRNGISPCCSAESPPASLTPYRKCQEASQHKRTFP